MWICDDRVQLSKSDKNIGTAGWRVYNIFEAAVLGEVLAHPCITTVCIIWNCALAIETLCGINILCIFYFCISNKVAVVFFILPVHVSMPTLPWQ